LPRATWLTLLVGAASGCGRLGFDAVSGSASASDAGRSSPDSLLAADAGFPTMTLVKKTGAPDWTPLTGPGLALPYGVVTWAPSGPMFRFRIEAWGLDPGASITVIQYIDPYPGAPATDIAAGIVDGAGYFVIPETAYELNRDLDTVNGKVWLVPSALVDTAADMFLAWDVTAILFELDFVVYDDTDV
jgi:hypothetical protein